MINLSTSMQQFSNIYFLLYWLQAHCPMTLHQIIIHYFLGTSTFYLSNSQLFFMVVSTLVKKLLQHYPNNHLLYSEIYVLFFDCCRTYMQYFNIYALLSESFLLDLCCFFLQVFVPCVHNHQWFVVVANFKQKRFDILNSDYGTGDYQHIINTVMYNFKCLFLLAYPHCIHFNIRDFKPCYVFVPKQKFRLYTTFQTHFYSILMSSLFIVFL